MSAGLAEWREAELHRHVLVLYSVMSVPEKNVGIHRGKIFTIPREITGTCGSPDIALMCRFPGNSRCRVVRGFTKSCIMLF
jgi:hypothetical protein